MIFNKRQRQSLHRFISYTLSGVLILNSTLSPILASRAYASEPTPTPTQETTPTPTPTIEVTETTPTPTPTPTPTKEPEVTTTQSVEVTPTPTPTPQTQPDLKDSPNSQSSAQLNPSLDTDKDDYTPSETVIITGSDYQPDTTYTLVVSSQDEPKVRDEVQVTTDSDGGLFYSYQLDGTYRPDYLVEILLGGVLVASTTFTDNNVCPHGGDWQKFELTDSDTSKSHTTDQGYIIDQVCIKYGQTKVNVPSDDTCHDVSGLNTQTATVSEGDECQDISHVSFHKTQPDLEDISGEPLACGDPIYANQSTDYVNIGDETSESGYNLNGWGPVEPDASGGNWGSGTPCEDGNCKVVYEPDGDPSASLILDFGNSPLKELRLRALDGISGADSFEVKIGNDLVYRWLDSGETGGSEEWKTHSFDVSDYSGVQTITITSLDDEWGSFDKYGQVAFTWIKVVDYECEEMCTPGKAWADEFILSDQGTRKDGSFVSSERTNPDSALGSPDSQFFSLGVEGDLTVKFVHPVIDQEAHDLSFHEIINGRTSYPFEKAKVEVSQDGTNWQYLGQVTNKDGGNGVGLLDIASLNNWSWIQYVRLTDITDYSLHANNADGYDIDAIDAVWQVCEPREPEPLPVCGNGIKEAEEQCDGQDGTISGQNFCTQSCQLVPIYDGQHQCPTGTNPIKVNQEPFTVFSTDPGGIMLSIFESGKDYLLEASGTFTPSSKEQAGADAGYTSIDGWTNLKPNIGLQALYGGSYTSDFAAHALLSDWGTGNVGVVDWGPYNQEHVYTKHFYSNGSDVQFLIGDRYDHWFGTDWDDQGGMSDNEGELELDVYECQPPVKLQATKVVCEEESDLPNWGTGGPNITATTAQDWVDSHSSCSIEPMWQFQWGPKGAGSQQTETSTDLLSHPWQTFASHETVEISNLDKIGSRIEVREVFPDSYSPLIPFSGDDQNDYSSEFYCNSDVFHYDNWEWINNPQYGETYHCVAFNALQKGQVSGYKYNDADGDGFRDQGEPGIQGWQIVVHPQQQKSFESLQVDSADMNGQDSSKTLIDGRYYLIEVEGQWTNKEFRQVDAEYYSDDSWSTQLDMADDPTRGDRQLDLVINDQDVVWGGYNSPHLYKTVIKGEGSTANFRIFDQDNAGSNPSSWYADNQGQLTVRIYDVTDQIYTTDQDGYYQAKVLPGEYQVLEILQTGWKQTQPSAPSYYDVQVTIEQPIEKDFGNRLGSISGYKLEDQDGSLDTDQDQTKVLGWQIDLYQCLSQGECSLHNSTHTDENGYFHFGGLVAGLYRLMEETRDNWKSLTSTQKDLELQAGEDSEKNDFVNTQYASIQGRKYNDVDASGDFEEDERIDQNRLNDWQITLYNDDWSFIDSMTTGDDSTTAGDVDKGQFRFENVVPGTYYVCETPQSGWMQTEPSTGPMHQNGTYCHQVTLTSAEDRGWVQFGNFELGVIQGRKYYDVNTDGIHQNETEERLDGWTVRLYKASGGPGQGVQGQSITGETDNPGQFRFENLTPGDYYVCEVSQQDWTQTGPNEGSEAIDNDGIETGTGTAVANESPNKEQEGPVCWHSQITESGQKNGWLKFGNIDYGYIKGVKWDDLNGNGQREEGEPGVPEWNIFIPGEGEENTANTLTGAQGNYSFQLPPGEYQVCESINGDVIQTYPGGENQCHTVVLEGGDEKTADFGNFTLVTIETRKFNDQNESHMYDSGEEEYLSGWTIRLDKQDSESPPECPDGNVNGEYCELVTDESGNADFTGLTAGTYIISEVLQKGWIQTRPNADYGGEGHQADGSYILKVTSGDDIPERLFGNYAPPELVLTKTNDRKGETLGVGDTILYTLEVTNNGQGPAYDVVIDDTQPPFDHFEIIDNQGTVTAPDDSTQTVTPTGGGENPYQWSIGDIQPGETFTLNFEIKITSVIDGEHTNIAIASGLGGNEEIYESDTVIDPFTIGSSFGVGGSLDIDEGDVLGASTEGEVLGAATGSATRWLILSIALIFGGLLLRLIDKKFFAKLLGLLLVIGIFAGLSTPVLAVDNTAPSIDIVNLPEYKKTDNFKISYSALDAGGSGLDKVILEYHKEGEGWQTLDEFTAHSKTYQITSSEINEEAKFYFKTTAYDNAGNSAFDETSTTVDRTPPPAPNSYSKAKIGPQTYRLQWRNPDHDQSYKVYIYRSDQEGFDAGTGNLIAALDVTADTADSWENAIPQPDQEYFYLMQNIDPAGNKSDLVGDKPQVQTAPQGQPVSEEQFIEGFDYVGSTGTGGQILGAEDQKDTQDQADQNDQDTTSQTETDQATDQQDTQTSQQGFLARYWWAIIITLSFSALVYLLFIS